MKYYTLFLLAEIQFHFLRPAVNKFELISFDPITHMFTYCFIIKLPFQWKYRLPPFSHLSRAFMAMKQ